MEENTTENETLINESEKEISITPESDGAETDKSMKTAIAQKEHFKEKAQKLEQQLNELKSKMPTNQNQGQDPIEIVKLTKALEGRSEDEVQFILRNAKGKDAQSIIDASKDEWVQAAIEAKREKSKRENKIPSPDNPSGESFRERGFLDIKGMSDADFDKYQKDLFEQSQRRKGGV
jgi:hypothetical protein